MSYLKPALFLFVTFGFSCLAASESSDWKQMDRILEAIELPVIPKNTVSILDFGAKEGGVVDCLPALNKALASLEESGGGTLLVPKGTWFMKGSIHLKSRINLHLVAGSHVLFSGEPADYLPAVKTRWEGTEVYSYSPLVYAANVTDVAITGPGKLDGNEASKFKDWQPLQDDDMQKLRKMGASATPVEQRVFTKGTHLRPAFVQFFGAERALLDGYTIVNAPFWINHLVYTKYATVRNLKVESHFPNNDGLDIESSQWVLVEDNWFRTGDDSIVVKSGRDLDGRTIGIPSQNIVIRNNDMSGEDGIALGSEMSGGIKNIFFTDNILRNGHAAIRFKANLDRGGVVEHIRIRNFKIESFNNLFWFQLDYPGEMGGNFPSTYRDIVFENIQVENARTFLEVHAPAVAPLTNVTFKNIQVKNVVTPLVIENATKLRFENVKIGTQTLDGELNWREHEGSVSDE